MADMTINRGLLAVSGLCGAAGVAVAAMASHQGGANVAIAANFLMFHAPALMGLSLLGASRLATIAGWVLAVGLVLFAGDLMALSELGASPLPIAAPLGGGLLILGWLLVIAAAIFGGRRPAA